MHRVIYALIFLLLATFTLSAQDSTQLPQKAWTLEDCISYARENNIQINSLRLSSDAARLDLQQSKYNRFAQYKRICFPIIGQ
jgi:outer membrane protein